jgi:hypothetical protein
VPPAAPPAADVVVPVAEPAVPVVVAPAEPTPVVDGGQGNGSTDPGMGGTTGTPGGTVADAPVA